MQLVDNKSGRNHMHIARFAPKSNGTIGILSLVYSEVCTIWYHLPTSNSLLTWNHPGFEFVTLWIPRANLRIVEDSVITVLTCAWSTGQQTQTGFTNCNLIECGTVTVTLEERRLLQVWMPWYLLKSYYCTNWQSKYMHDAVAQEASGWVFIEGCCKYLTTST